MIALPAGRGRDALDLVVVGLGAALLAATAWIGLEAVALDGSDSAALARTARRERIFLFPLGVATSITTIVALLRGGELGSRRSRLRGAAVVVLFVLGFLVHGPIADTTRAAVVATADLGATHDRWRLLHALAFVLVGAATALLALAHLCAAPPAPEEKPGGLTARHRVLLFLLGAATFFEGYDRFITSLALPYIGEDLGADEATLGFALSAIRLGALLSIPLGRAADRRGRRGLLLFTILAYTLATAATGLSQGIEAFVVFQLLAMIFLLTELSLAQVVVAEEFPRDFRAQGQAFLGAFGALGAGFAAVIFPILQETALGWRGLYFVGLFPLLLIAWLRRALPETERWQQARDSGRTEETRLLDLLRGHTRGRFLVLVALAAAIAAAAAPAFAFASYRATRAFDWAPEDVSGMILVGGGLGLGGWFVFGVLAERLGRRAVVTLSFAGAAAAIAVFYQTSSLWLAFAAMVFSEAGAALGVSALGTEVFATEVRSTAKTWISSAGILGAMVGLGIVGLAADRLGGADAVITVLALVPVVVCPLVWLLPEPRGRELEELAGGVPPSRLA